MLLMRKDISWPFNGIQMEFPLIKQSRLLFSYLKSSVAIIAHIYLNFLAFFMLTLIGMQLGTTMFNA